MDEVRSSLGFRLLVRMVIRVSLVLLLVTTLAYAYVYRCVQTIALGDLRSYVAEHGEYENQLFTETQGHLQQLRQAYVNGLAMPATNASETQFAQRYVFQADGVWRRRPQDLNINRDASVFLAAPGTPTEDTRRRLLLMDELVSEYGRAWRGEAAATTYISSLDGLFAGFWPGVELATAHRPAVDLDYLQRLEQVPLSERVGAGPGWTGIWYDQGTRAWYSDCLLPLVVKGQIRGYFGSAMPLESILRRLTPAPLSGSYTMLFRGDGRLISHPAHMRDIAASGGNYDMRRSPDLSLRIVYQTVLAAGNQTVLVAPQLDAHIGVTRLQGTGWYLVSVYPHAAVARVARGAATHMLWLGILGVLLSLPFLYLTINAQVAQPLRHLLAMAESLERGTRNVAVNIRRNDEIGQLAATFNRLAVMIRERDSALRAYAEGLEQLVDERTVELKQAKEAAEYLSLHDDLTQLANRRLFLQLLEQSMHQAQRNLQPLALVFIDVNDFKIVNDQFGHATGDEVLATIAKRIQATVRRPDTAARFAGDEFVVLLPELTDVNDAVQVMEKLRAAVGEPIEAFGNTLNVSVSMGVAVYPIDGSSASALLQHADEQMYRDKSRIAAIEDEI